MIKIQTKYLLFKTFILITIHNLIFIMIQFTLTPLLILFMLEVIKFSK